MTELNQDQSSSTFSARWSVGSAVRFGVRWLLLGHLKRRSFRRLLFSVFKYYMKDGCAGSRLVRAVERRIQHWEGEQGNSRSMSGRLEYL